MKIRVACFAAILWTAAGPAAAQSVSDSGTGDTDAQVDAEFDAASIDDASAAPDGDLADAAPDGAPANGGGTASDAASDGSAANVDGGGAEAGSAAADAGPPPPPIHQFDDASPGCSVGAVAHPGVGGSLSWAFVALSLAGRRYGRRLKASRGSGVRVAG